MGQLFLKEPSALKEALRSFTAIEQCIYVNKYVGGSGQLEIMPCECSQQSFLKSRSSRRHKNKSSQNEIKSEEESDLCGPDSNCINRLTFMECYGDQCGCPTNAKESPRCQNQRFQNREYANIDVFKAGAKGYGVRALEPISEGTFIYEYTGEVLDESRFVKRQQKYERENVKHFYFMMLQKEEYIDATEKGSIARFCNHSCNPNAIIEKWVVGPKLRMGLFAKRDICAGEEICFDYKVDRYGSKAQPCHCNEPNCSGFLGGRTQTGGGPLPPSVIEGLGLDSETLSKWPERARERLMSRGVDLARVLEVQRHTLTTQKSPRKKASLSESEEQENVKPEIKETEIKTEVKQENKEEQLNKSDSQSVTEQTNAPQLSPKLEVVNEVQMEMQSLQPERNEQDEQKTTQPPPTLNLKGVPLAEEDLANLPMHIPLPVKPLTELELQSQPVIEPTPPPLPEEIQEIIPKMPPMPTLPSGSLDGSHAPPELLRLPPVVLPVTSEKRKNKDSDLRFILDCIPVNEEVEVAREILIETFPLTTIEIDELPEFMRILMQLQETPWVIRLMLMRVLKNEDPKLQSSVLNMHGYQIMGQVLKRWEVHDDVVQLVLKVLQSWPKVTKNKISSSQIESIVREIKESSDSEVVRKLASDLMEEWSGLSMGYRIPRRSEPVAKTGEQKPDLMHAKEQQQREQLQKEQLLREQQEREQRMQQEQNTDSGYDPIGNIRRPPQRSSEAENEARQRRRAEEEERQRQQAAARERQRQQLEIQKIIEAAQAPPPLPEPEPMPEPISEPPKRKISETESILAAYIPKLVFVYEEELGHDRCKRHAKDIVQVLYKKEANNTNFELTKDRKNKIKGFVKNYMTKVVQRHRKPDANAPSPKKHRH